MYQSDLTHHACQRHSPDLLRKVLDKEFKSKINDLDALIKTAMSENSWDSLYTLMDKFSHCIRKEQWLTLIDWAVIRIKNCPQEQSHLYAIIHKEFPKELCQHYNYWFKQLAARLDLFEQRLNFCPAWVYPSRNYTAGFFTNLSLENKMILYKYWWELSLGEDKDILTTWNIIRQNESDELTSYMVEILTGVKRFSRAKELLDRAWIKISHQAACTKGIDAQYYFLTLKILLFQHSELQSRALQQFIEAEKSLDWMREFYTTIHDTDIALHNSFPHLLIDAILNYKKLCEKKNSQEKLNLLKKYSKFAEKKMSCTTSVIFSARSRSSSSLSVTTFSTMTSLSGDSDISHIGKHDMGDIPEIEFSEYGSCESLGYQLEHSDDASCLRVRQGMFLLKGRESENGQSVCLDQAEKGICEKKESDEEKERDKPRVWSGPF